MKNILGMNGVTLLVLVAGIVLQADAEMRPQLMAYRSFKKECAETAAFAKMGVPVRAVGICNTYNALGAFYSDYSPVWLGPGEYDFSVVDRIFNDLLSASPDARFICLLDLNTPLWFARTLHLDSFEAISHAVTVPEWRQETSKYLNAVLDYVERRWGNRIVAYSIMAGLTTEWFEMDTKFSSSEPKDKAWREWCAKRNVDFGPTVPTLDEMSRGTFEGVMFDPASEARKIAFWKFHNGVVADAILDFAHQIRTVVGSSKQIGTFFGYYYICNPTFGSVCHLDYERVVASPDIDFFSSPATYTDRGCGTGTGSMTVSGTLRRHGKRVLHEIDFWPDTLTPPWAKRPGWGGGYLHNPQETVAANTREAIFAFVNGLSFWWFDMWGGMYANQDLRKRIARIAELHAKYRGEIPPPDADVLIVADPDSAYSMADPNPMCPDGFCPTRAGGETLRNVINRTGVVYDTCSFEDLPHLNLSRVKMIVLGGTWVITPQKARILEECVLKDDRTVVWCYAPGVSDGCSIDVRRVCRWAGVDFKTRGVAHSRRKGWRSVYAYDWRNLTVEVLRQIESQAGCFLYVDKPTPVVCNGKLLALHVGKPGRLEIRLPYACEKIVDVFSGRVVASDACGFSEEFVVPDAKLYELVRRR